LLFEFAIKGFKNKLLNITALFVNFALVEIVLIFTKAKNVMFQSVYSLSTTIANLLAH